jgi:hypothetical protein
VSTETEDVTQALWVTRATTTVRHIRGLLEGLEGANALDYAQVTIMAVGDEGAIVLPGGKVIQQIDLPVQGLLILPDTSP